MPYLISLLIASLLFFGFLLLTMYEARHGARFFAASRYRLDTRVSRLGYLVKHIDWGSFTAQLTRTSLETVAHDVAHLMLVLVRTVERGLTRTVRALRTRREGALLPPGSPDDSRLTSAVTFLSQNLRRSRRTRPMNDIVRRDTTEQ